jgi:hypothetical protein
VDHRTDVYSLGATLYELLTLQPVCCGVDHQELLHAILHEDPIPPRRLCKDIPRDLETILLKALGKQVEERYATAQDMADDLRRLLDGLPVQARRPRLWERAAKWARRHKPVVVSALVLLVLSVLGLTAANIVIGREQAKVQEAYEQESRALAAEAQARKTEAEARARAERNLVQARRLLEYIAEIAEGDMAAESNVPNVRRKLLQVALSYYEDFIEQHKDNQLTREELLRGHARVANILEAIGRRQDAQAVRKQASRIALTIGDGHGSIRLVSPNRKLRLLRLASVQEELKLSPDQVRGILELEARRSERPRDLQGEQDQNMLTLRGQNGKVFPFEVTGRQQGPVWGTDTYTDDSSVAAAAVHAGVLQPGQKGVVAVTILPGRETYTGSVRHGVTTASWTAWAGSFKVDTLAGALEKQALALLRTEQVRRLKQLLLQQDGIWAFDNQVVVASLQLTRQQRDAMAALQKEGQASRPDGTEGSPAPRLSVERLLGVLTPEQQTRWHNLVGEKFKGNLPPQELVLTFGRMTLELEPAGGARDAKKSPTGPPTPEGRAP